MGAAEDGYGDLHDRTSSPRPPYLIAGVVAVLAIGAVTAIALLSRDGSDETAATTSEASGTTATTDPPEPEPTTSTTSEGPAWTVPEGGLPEYITDPVFYAPGTPEAEVEVAYVNAEISSLRALAQPTVTEPEVEQLQEGFALAAINQSRQILLEDGQFIETGGLSRIEIEDITFNSEDQADIETCSLAHSISIVVADPSDRLETIRTLHAVQRMVRGADGQWRLSELLTMIQNVDGFGACLDVTLTPVEPEEAPESSAAEPEESSG